MSDLVKIHKKRLWVLCCHKKKEITYYAILWQPVTACDRKKWKLSRPKALKTGRLRRSVTMWQKNNTLYTERIFVLVFIYYIYIKSIEKNCHIVTAQRKALIFNGLRSVLHCHGAVTACHKSGKAVTVRQSLTESGRAKVTWPLIYSIQQKMYMILAGGLLDHTKVRLEKK